MNNIEKFNLLVANNSEQLKRISYPSDIMTAGKELANYIIWEISNYIYNYNKAETEFCKNTDTIIIPSSLCIDIFEIIKEKRQEWIKTLNQIFLDNNIDSFAISSYDLGRFNSSSINHVLCLINEYGWGNITIKTIKKKSLTVCLLIFKRV